MCKVYACVSALHNSCIMYIKIAEMLCMSEKMYATVQCAERAHHPLWLLCALATPPTRSPGWCCRLDSLSSGGGAVAATPARLHGPSHTTTAHTPLPPPTPPHARCPPVESYTHYEIRSLRN